MRIPTPATQGAAPLGDVQENPVQTLYSNVRALDMGQPGRDLSALGSAVGGVATVMQRRTDERILLELQNEMQDLENEIFDPRTGVMARLSGDAIGATEEIQQRMDDFKQGWSTREGLSATGRQAADKYLLSATGRVVGRTRDHETGEDLKYAVELIDAQISSQATKVAMADPTDPEWSDTEFDGALAKVTQLTSSLADRMGWDSEKVEVELDRRTSQLVSARIMALVDVHDDPEGAFTFLKAHKEELTGDTWSKLYPVLKDATETRQVNTSVMQMLFEEGSTPANVHEAANMLVQDAFSLTPTGRTKDSPVVPGSWSNVSLNLGPARPNPPNAPVMHVLSSSTAAVLGAGGRVEVYSGQEGDKPQHGSERHKTGAAADVRFYRADGTLVQLNDPEFVEIAYSMAYHGALGIGFGIEYMGHGMHVDLIDPNANKGEGHVWGSGAKAHAAALTEAMVTGDAERARELLGLPEGVRTGEANVKAAVPTDIAQLYQQYGDKPELFMKALQTYNTLQREVRTQMDRQKDDVIDDIYTRISTARSEGAHVELDDVITQQERVMLGSDVATVESYYSNTMGTDLIQTTEAGWDLVDRVVELGSSPNPADLETLLSMNFAKDVRPHVDDATYGVLTSVRDAAMTRRAAQGIPFSPVIPNYSQIQTVVKNVAEGMPSFSAIKDDAEREEMLMRLTDQAVAMATDFSAGEQAEVDQNMLYTLMRRQMLKTSIDQQTYGGEKDLMMPMAIAQADDVYDSWEDLVDEGFSFVSDDGDMEFNQDLMRGIAFAWREEHGYEILPSQLLTRSLNLFLFQNPSAANGMRVYDRTGSFDVGEVANPLGAQLWLDDPSPSAMEDAAKEFFKRVEDAQ